MQSCIVIQTLLYPPIYINENSIDEYGFKSQNILVLSWYQSPLTDQRRDPWPILTLSPLLRQPPMLPSLPRHLRHLPNPQLSSPSQI
jgi:hypothetical protein